MGGKGGNKGKESKGNRERAVSLTGGIESLQSIPQDCADRLEERLISLSKGPDGLSWKDLAIEVKNAMNLYIDGQIRETRDQMTPYTTDSLPSLRAKMKEFAESKNACRRMGYARWKEREMIAFAILLQPTPAPQVSEEEREEAAWRAEKRRHDRNKERREMAAANARMEAEEMEREAETKRRRTQSLTTAEVKEPTEKEQMDLKDQKTQPAEQPRVQGTNSLMLSCSKPSCEGNWEGERESVPAFCHKCGSAWSGATDMAVF